MEQFVRREGWLARCLLGASSAAVFLAVLVACTTAVSKDRRWELNLD